MKARSIENKAQQRQRGSTEVLSGTERAELHRQGAKAAARGDKPSSNPMNQPPNLPSATGESSGIWQQRKEAWTEGHDLESKNKKLAAPPARASKGVEPGDE